MALPVSVQLRRAGQWQSARIRFGLASDADRISKWPDFLAQQNVGTGTAKEAGDYARDSVERWKKHGLKGRVADSPDRYASLVKADPDDDIAILLVIEADWWTADLLGFAYLRRTWAGSLYMEFLAKHPMLAFKELPDLRVTDVAEAMVVGIAALIEGMDDDCRPAWVWWEATAGSFRTYERLFAPTTPKDLVIVSARELANCRCWVFHEFWPV